MKGLFMALALYSCNAIATTADTLCKAYTLYRESGAESLQGQRAVMDVLENRMRNRGLTACQVMTQRNQFSFFRKGAKISVTMEMLMKYFQIEAMNHVLPPTAEYFHNKSVKPPWAKRLKRVATIGNQLFYEGI